MSNQRISSPEVYNPKIPYFTGKLQKQKSEPRFPLLPQTESKISSTFQMDLKKDACFRQSQVWQQIREDKYNSSPIRYFLPYFMRLKIKDIREISYKDSSAIVNGTLLINICFKNIYDVMKSRSATRGKILNLKAKVVENLILQIKYSDQLKLQKSPQITVEKGEGDSDIFIRVRKDFKVLIHRNYSQIFYSPFQRLVFIASFGLHKIILQKTFQQEKWQEATEIYFNSMNFNQESIKNILKDRKNKMQQAKMLKNKKLVSQLDMQKKQTDSKGDIKEQPTPEDIFARLSSESCRLYCQHVMLSSEDQATYGDYKLATKLKTVESSSKPLYRDMNNLFSDIPKQWKKQQNNQKNFHCEFTHFCFTLYRDPIIYLFSILIPIVFLGILSLVVYFLQHNLTNRITIIATLLLGFIQLIPSIRQQLTDETKISAIEMIAYLSTLTCFLSLIDSFNPINLSAEQLIDYYTFMVLWRSNKLFFFSVLINISCLLCTLTWLLYFKLYFQKYKLLEPSSFRDYNNKPQLLSNKTKKQGTVQFVKQNDESSNREDFKVLKKTLNIPTKYLEEYGKFWNNKEVREFINQRIDNLV